MSIILSTLFTCMVAMHPKADTIQWNYSALKTGNKTWEVHIRAHIDSSWHIYSQTTPEEGSQPTQITFNPNPLLHLKGKIQEKGQLVIDDKDVFGVTVKYYKNQVEFIQQLKIENPTPTIISGTITYMLCNGTQALPAKTIEFSIPLE